MKVHFIIHESYEGAGAFMTWAQNKGYAISSTKIYLGETLPVDDQFIDLLIVLGGPQCPETTEQECHYFKVDEEVTFIRDCIENSKAVVGVCLGAQLIGEALGAKFERSPNKEIGYLPIELINNTSKHPKFNHYDCSEIVGHWHNDMPGLTSTSKVLAKSAGCPRQIVEYSNLVYGFQCHLEFTTETINELIESSIDELNTFSSHNFVQSPEYIANYSSKHMNALLIDFLDKLVDEYKSK
jgi:GMP synthase (glutamine-hydrolysing)